MRTTLFILLSSVLAGMTLLAFSGVHFHTSAYHFHTSAYHSHAAAHHSHSVCVDVAFGTHTLEELEKLESYVPPPGLGTKTRLLRANGHQNKTLTIVIDFKDSTQPITTDIIGNNVGSFDVTEYGFDSADFDLVVQAIMDEVQEDFFEELAGTIANQDGMDLSINFIEGDIGTPPPGVAEYYFVQVGTGLDGPFTFALGVARGSSVRNSDGTGPNNDAEIGDVVASVFTDNINNLGGLSPSNALTNGNLTFSRNAIVGTLSHEIGHVLSLSHINVNNSQQPTPSAEPLMGTGAIDLPNQARITDREFSLFGMNLQDGNNNVEHISQLTAAVGLDPVFDGLLDNVSLNIISGISAGEITDLEESDANVLSIVTEPENEITQPPVQFEVISETPVLTPASLTLNIESSANSPNLSQQIEILNFTTGDFEIVDLSNLPQESTTTVIDLSKQSGDYIDPATCQIQCRVSVSATGPVLFFPWTIEIDQLRFEVQP